MPQETMLLTSGRELPRDLLDQAQHMKPLGFTRQIMPAHASPAALAAAVREAEYPLGFVGFFPDEARSHVTLTPHTAGPMVDSFRKRFQNGYAYIQRVAQGQSPGGSSPTCGICSQTNTSRKHTPGRRGRPAAALERTVGTYAPRSHRQQEWARGQGTHLHQSDRR